MFLVHWIVQRPFIHNYLLNTSIKAAKQQNCSWKSTCLGNVYDQIPAMDLGALWKRTLKKIMHFEQNFQLLYIVGTKSKHFNFFFKVSNFSKLCVVTRRPTMQLTSVFVQFFKGFPPTFYLMSLFLEVYFVG